MNPIEALARVVLAGESLNARSLFQDILKNTPHVHEWRRPESQDPRVLAAAAALTDLCAQRLNQTAPDWTKEVGPLSEPVYLLKSAATMKRLRTLCETESPEPLRKRHLYAPPNFLEFA